MNELNILSDVTSTGREIPWAYNKIGNEMVASSLKRMGHEKLAKRVYKCGTILEYSKDLETLNKRLINAKFCGLSLCPICQRRMALSRFYELKKVVEQLQEKNKKKLKYVLVTLTIKNVTAENLEFTIAYMLRKFNKFKKLVCITKNFDGYYRSLEVTYNEEKDTYHPHLHILFLAKPGYFDKENKYYMRTEDLAVNWGNCLDLDYIPVCDMRKINGEKGLIECCKYVNKTSDVLRLEQEKRDEVIDTLYRSLYRKRLVGYGGLLKEECKKVRELQEERKMKAQGMQYKYLMNLTGKYNIETGRVTQKESYFWDGKEYRRYD